MISVFVRRAALVGLLFVCFTSLACGGRAFYPVKGSVFVNGKPGEGVMVVFHPQNDPDPEPSQPTAVVHPDGSFEIKTWIVKDRVLKVGAPAGNYWVTCVWYPPDLQKHLSAATLPDRLHGRYSDPKTSGLRVEVAEKANELPPFKLEIDRK